ncbi:MAG: hypothetical protein V3U93_08240, partial [Alphaproteobacteria bacterium]
ALARLHGVSDVPSTGAFQDRRRPACAASKIFAPASNDHCPWRRKRRKCEALTDFFLEFCLSSALIGF